MFARQFQNEVQYPDKRALVITLVDEDVDCDRRVLASIKEYADVQVIDCRKLQRKGMGVAPVAVVKAFYTLIVALTSGFTLWNRLRRLYVLSTNSFSKGFYTSLKSFIRAHLVADELHSKTSSARVIHAHDLFCGVIGTILVRRYGARFIYDAHEVEPHRNRNNGWLRMAFDWSVEKSIIEAAHEVRVVNRKVAELYCLAYPVVSSCIRVVTNDHFQQYPIRSWVIPSSESTMIVYVGGGVKGRELEMLAHAGANLNIPVHAFFINTVPLFAIQAGWLIGGRNYENELVELISSNRCLMWCCVEHASLSYRLSLPNKFFQALAVGMPIIVSAGGYLEEIVREHRIGAVFDGTNFDHIVMRAKSDAYLSWVNQVKFLRDEINKGQIQL